MTVADEFNVDMALLSALVNAQLSSFTTETNFSGAGGNGIANLIGEPSGNGLYGVRGWEAVSVTFEKIRLLAPNVASYADMYGLAAATFVKGNQAIIAFRGTESSVPDWVTDGAL